MPNIRDIVGMGIDGQNNVCFAWYQDGTVSAGSSRDLGLGASAGPPLVRRRDRQRRELKELAEFRAPSRFTT